MTWGTATVSSGNGSTAGSTKVMQAMGNNSGGGSSSTSSSSNSYLQAIQSLLAQNQANQNNQLATQQSQQNQLLSLQQGQVQKAEQLKNDATMATAETSAQSYVALLKQLVSISGRDKALDVRMFS